MIMKLAIAGDSAGDGLARVLADHLKASHEVTLIDMDAAGAEYYANLSEFVGNRVLAGEFERAILVCGTGIGVAMSANKVRGIRAAQTNDTYSAERAALSNNAQIITMGARVIGAELAKSIAEAYLAQSFDPNGRSASNVAAIDALDG
jgi:ribose 5-phosphate isomerase B